MRARLALAASASALLACLSYAAQRLIDRVGEPPMGAVLLQAHVPYYWRVGAATLHALILGVTLYSLLREAQARAALAPLARWAWVVALPAAAAMALFP